MVDMVEVNVVSKKSSKKAGFGLGPSSPKRLAVMADLSRSLPPLPLSSSLRPQSR